MTTNTSVKKAYVELIELLQANEGKKVSTIMPQILELVQGKTNSKTFFKDDKGNVVAIFCYYHKKWELVSEQEYGSKINTATGLNTMCKEGVSHWGKQQREFKKAKEALLADLMSGELAQSDLQIKMDELEVAKDIVVPCDHGFDTLEEALEFNNIV